MKVLIFGKNISDKQVVYVQQLVECLENNGAEIVFYEPFYKILNNKLHLHKIGKTISTHSHFVNMGIDILFSIGGDGTLLDSIALIRDSLVPILGINLGRLGFLSSTPSNEIAFAVSSIIENNYTIERRTLLEISNRKKLINDFNFALNEISILKEGLNTMIQVDVFVNKIFLNTYWGDGVIIATPTGSTAYSLSCNGPILTPDSENFVITPVATHNLTVRPIVIPDNSLIEIKVTGRQSDTLIGMDSRVAHVSNDIELSIRKADFYVNLIKRSNDNFFNTIRQKLLWGQDIRN